MDITHTTENSVTIITLSGRFDASTVKDFKSTVNSLIIKTSGGLVFDMAAVTFVDSTALGSLVSLLRAFREKDGDIKIAALTNKIRSVFDLTRLNQVFDIYDDPQAAVRSFSSD
ncbi:STAS domain-containing protein [Desulfosediminicola flagellatus]|uniref:STAS domain-containing protein n=1 Tax=Desulfosediminicola flagellatus TaxID=2569541 RepID=UPI0010AD8288|nr:STAS domain-containing protein [Desulfosediminicola flagellatus]